MTAITADQLSAAVEFDSPFRTTPQQDGSAYLERWTSGVYAPEVTDNGMGGVWISPDNEWTALQGYTGQHGYSGPIMHVSETLSGGLARDVLATAGVYVIVEVRDEGGSFPDSDAIGWVILRRD